MFSGRLFSLPVSYLPPTVLWPNLVVTLTLCRQKRTCAQLGGLVCFVPGQTFHPARFASVYIDSAPPRLSNMARKRGLARSFPCITSQISSGRPNCLGNRPQPFAVVKSTGECCCRGPPAPRRSPAWPEMHPSPLDYRARVSSAGSPAGAWPPQGPAKSRG